MASYSIVTQEEFKMFHNIDRLLYTRLVVNLERDTGESMQVMGFLIWLESSGHIGIFIDKMLSLPDSVINSISEEVVLCLNCIQNENFRHFQNIPLLHSVSKTGLSLLFLHENRLSIMGPVSKIVTQVCSRAFHDITSQVEKLREIKRLVTFPLCGQGISETHVLPTTMVYNSNPYIIEEGRFGSFMHGEISDMLSRIQICTRTIEEDRESSSNVPVDDRTIFLTFSKGYPILEDEVRDFFSRKYGECIEAIYMQEVMAEEQQPLYARLVVYSPGMIEKILNGNSKAKFSINGKHVWARKYVRKNLKSPPRSSSPSSSSSPTAHAIPSSIN